MSAGGSRGGTERTPRLGGTATAPEKLRDQRRGSGIGTGIRNRGSGTGIGTGMRHREDHSPGAAAGISVPRGP